MNLLKRNCFIASFSALILLMCDATAASPQDETTRDVVYQARRAAAADEHHKAITLYLSAIDQKPSLRSDLSLELGNQYTWAELPDSAIEWYSHYLAKHPDNLDAKIGIARALSWDDRLQESVMYYESLLADSGERRNEVRVGLAKVKSWQRDLATAERIYRQVLADDLDNRDARLGLAEVTSWSGRPRQAREMYREILLEDPGSTEARKGLAQTYNSVGRSDIALSTLRSVPTTDELLKEAREIPDRGSISGENTFVYRDNTTDGDFTALRVGINMSVAHLTRAGVLFTRARLTQPSNPHVTRDEFLFPLRQRFTEALAVNFSPGYQWNDFDPVTLPPSTQPVDEFNLFVWDAYATVTPVDWVRIDVGNARQVLDIPRSIFRRIDVVTTNVGLDWRLHRTLSTFWEPSYSTYGDGNERFAFGQRLEWVPPVRMPIDGENRVVLSQGSEYMSFKRQLNNDYFNPVSYLYLFGGVRVVADVAPRVNISVEGRVGGERAAGLDWKSVGSFDGALQIRLTKSVYLRTGYSHSGSRLTSPDGFRSKGFFVSLDYSLLR
ncbi:MAG: tetratricopeptide repeat protein [Candidatus Krumholzibacteria bacterium]|nr:tetratricopeptide repeat protein [Candidatus Krumholzibacteria bacterium]